MPQRSPRQGASTGMQYAYLGHTVTLTWRDPRSKFKIDLSMITNIWVDPAWREEHDGLKIILLA